MAINCDVCKSMVESWRECIMITKCSWVNENGFDTEGEFIMITKCSWVNENGFDATGGW